MTILVTGAAGGLGRLLVAALREEPEEVVAASRAECDVTDASSIQAMLSRTSPRLIYHLAGDFSDDLRQAHRTNVDGAMNVLEASSRMAARPRLVFLGTAAEYGLVSREDNPVREDHALRPVSAYGITKAMQTQLAQGHVRARGTDVVIARMFNLLAAGLSERLLPGRVMRFVEAYRHDASARLRVGSLDSQRDYIEAPAAIAQLRSIAARGVAGGVYHVASGIPITVRDMLHGILDRAGVPRTVIEENTPGMGRAPGYDVPVIYADMTATRSLA